MKRTCAYCRAVYDDGLPRPPHWEDIPPEKNHGICKGCLPRVEKEIDALLEKLKREKR